MNHQTAVRDHRAFDGIRYTTAYTLRIVPSPYNGAKKD